ncbi:NAD-dependent epimerase/dehydratase family protein [Geojedonia litorea]|uniref:NAD-dependent epimerase/dehydratase family protein n=1 Tax=Geojedonia litorea TaxID=1268269 RepID=A0ABV9N6Z7_9FLAO
MKVFITGATGYVGHQLALKLASQHYSVQALVRDTSSANLPNHMNITVFEGDICDYNSILKAMKGCVYVFHTAAYTNLKCKSIDNFYNCNVVGTENILQAALELKVKKVIYTSTLSVFGPSYKEVPITEEQPRLTSYANDYELTKAMSEEAVLNYTKKGLSCVILNLTRVYGPGLSTFSNGVNKLITMIAKNDVLVVPSRFNITSNYVFIDDVIDAHLLAIQSGKSGEKYIIGGENLNYDELFKRIKSFTKSKIKILKVNYDLVKNSLFLSSKIFGLSTITPKVLDAIFTNRSASSQKAIAQLSYKITPFNKGLHQTINFLSK